MAFARECLNRHKSNAARSAARASRTISYLLSIAIQLRESVLARGGDIIPAEREAERQSPLAREHSMDFTCVSRQRARPPAATARHLVLRSRRGLLGKERRRLVVAAKKKRETPLRVCI